jgi:CelD/BcsL family acetyltransferase involved in cellulose biosynthesis
MMRISFQPLTDIESLGAEWLKLEAVSNPSFYTTWTWMDAWLRSLPTLRNVFVASMRFGEDVVGLAIVSLSSRRRLSWTVKQTFLNQFGDQAYDSLFIEFNGVLSRREHNAPTLDALIEELIVNPPGEGWDELHLAGIQQYAIARRVGHANGLHVETVVRPAHFVDLEALRRDGKTYLASLGQNTRRRIKRASEEYAKQFGPISLSVATTSTQAVDYLSELITLHQKYWIGRGETGAFANPHFRAFHQNLVSAATNGGAELLRVSAGDKTIGCIYVFLAGGVAYYYQSGFEYGLVEKHDAPGYVCLALTTEHYLNQGVRTFEFLAGTEEYKTRLGHKASSLAWVVLQQPRILLRLERWARKTLRAAWRLFRRWQSNE